MTARQARLAAVALAVATAGCAGGSEGEPFGAEVVWSDDDERIAVVPDHDEGLRSFHDLRIARPDGSFERTLLEHERGSVHSVHFMRTAGYILLRGLIGETATRFTHYVDRIELDGTRRRLYEGEEHAGYIVPSPDGSVLARVLPDFDECREAWRTDSGECPLTVEMLDPTDGSGLAPPVEIRFEPKPDQPQTEPDWVFRPSGTLVVSDELTAFAVAPTGELLGETDPPRCFLPRTASSDISSDGRTAAWIRLLGELEVSVVEAPGYPERCFGD